MATKKKNRGLTLIELFLAILIIAILLTMILPPCHVDRSARRMVCTSKQKQIAIALHNYYDKYDQFPPAYVTDKEGKPLYSWRVLVLPFLDQEAMYNEFHLDEPWDSPHNKKLSETTIPVFQCPSCPPENSGMTNYVLVTGPGTIWEEKEACPKKDIAAPSQTLMLVEVNSPDIHWAEPKDLKIDDIDPSFLNKEGDWLTIHPGVVVATFVDGGVECISEEEMLESLKIRSQIKTSGDWQIMQEQKESE